MPSQGILTGANICDFRFRIQRSAWLVVSTTVVVFRGRESAEFDQHFADPRALLGHRQKHVARFDRGRYGRSTAFLAASGPIAIIPEDFLFDD